MRTLFAFGFLVFLTTSTLSGQIVPPAVSRAPARGETGIYLVTFRPDVPASQRAAVVQASGARLRGNYNATRTVSVEIPDTAALARLRNDPRVLSAFANRTFTLDVVQGRGGAGGNSNSKPKAPVSLGATPVSVSQINLVWTDASDNETGFAIERCTGSGCAGFSEIFRTGSDATTYNNAGLTAQTVYRYRVLAFNAAGNSKYSNIAETTTPAAPPPPPVPPAAPGTLISSAVSYSQINLSWSDNSTNESGFAIERCADSGCAAFSEIFRTGPNVTAYSNSGLTAQTVYRYRVLAFNAVGNSTYSNIAETTTPAEPPPPPVPPAAPGNLISSAASYSQINLGWSDNSSDETGFAIERCADSGCAAFSEVFRTGPNVTAYSDSGLTAQMVYRYRVLAFNTVGNSTYSNIAETTTPAEPPPPPVPPAAPGNLISSAASYSQINLSWSDNSSDETGFAIERCTDSGCAAFSEIFRTGPNVTAYSDSGLTAQTVYRYRVLAFNAVGNSTYSNIAETTTPAEPPPPPVPPAAPGNLISSAASYSQINLSWSDNSSDENGFAIQRCTGTLASCTDASFLQIAQVGTNVSSFSNVGLQGGTTYTYRVRAFNAVGPSAYSNSVQATTPAAPPSTQVIPSGVQRIGAAPGRVNWTGAGVGVAVVDTGRDFSHPDLGGQPEIVGVNSFNAFGGSCQDIHGHGTHVAGIIAALNNGIDVVGVAPNATIYCVNVFQTDPIEGVIATDESVLAGLEWILEHANSVTPRIRVVNMSLGREKTIEDDDPNHPLHLAIKALYDSGISVVVAAGNDPLREGTEMVPAGYPEVVAVASTTARQGVNGYDTDFPACAGLQSIKADTASYFTTDGRFVGGTGVTVSAPGEQQEDMFDFLGSCFLEPIGILSLASGGGTIELSGTSMASPHVAGVVALMWEQELSLGLTLSPESARNRIRDNVDRRGTAPLDSPLEEYTFDGEREGVVWAPSALLAEPPPDVDTPPTVSILSPAAGSSFPAGASITFQGTATDPEDGNIAPSLRWTSSRDGQIGTGAGFTRTLSSGNHTITAALVDSGENPGSASISITVGSASTPTTVHASSVTYSMQSTTLRYTVRMVNEFGGPVAGATVRTSLYEFIFTGTLWFSNATTDSQGYAQFQLPNADFGCYTTLVENVVAAGLTWVPGTPTNSFCR